MTGPNKTQEESPSSHRYTDASDLPVKKDSNTPVVTMAPNIRQPSSDYGDPKLRGAQLLTEQSHPGVLGYQWSTRKKWTNLVIVFLVQCSMNFNTSLYANGQAGMAKEFGVSDVLARSGAALFLITYAFGCELWAPWSEEFGRKTVLQASLGLINLFAFGPALARNITTVLICRSLGGLASAGGSITLGIVADMYKAKDQMYAVAFVVLSSVGGSIFGPIVGGYVEDLMPWRWAMWFQVIAGAVVQLLHLLWADETQPAALLTREAERLRAAEKIDVRGPNDGKTWKELLQPKQAASVWIRPFKMFATEPIVSVLSLLSGFSDALIFMGFQSFGVVYRQWHLEAREIGLTFIAIGIGYVISYLFFITIAIPRIRKYQARSDLDEKKTEYGKYEMRLWGLLWTAPFLPLGLLIFAWTSNARNHWMGPVVGSLVIGVANFAVYQATIDYMVAAYGSKYSASATGGNGFARDFLAGCLTWAAIPYYDYFKKVCPGYPLEAAGTVLMSISFVLVAAAFWIYFAGPKLRARSKYFKKMMEDEEKEEETNGIQLQPSMP